jgi:hypothetical protein
MSQRPHFGFTKRGLAVHARTLDHLAPAPGASAAARFNAWVAVKVSRGVGSMWCAYVFAGIALISLPAAIASHSVIILVAWVAQTFLQLVLLSVIMVGQDVQSQASDARAAKTFEDAEVIADRLDEHTDGGIKTVLDAIEALPGAVAQAVTQAAGQPAGKDTQ